MMSRACIGGGVVTAVPNWTSPEVVEWGPTEVDSKATAGSAYMRHAERKEDEQAALRREFAEQQLAEFRKIRALA